MKETDFYLGTHHPYWLYKSEVPLFISRRALAQHSYAKKAVCRWALDSGGFTELSMYGKYLTSAEQYVTEARSWIKTLGELEWAATQDWMCEPFILKKTGLDILTHQRNSISSYIDLKNLAPEINWIPVLQGWTLRDYKAHIDLYYKARIFLHELPLVGIGSICRRQNTSEAERIIREIASQNIKLHGFGFKIEGLRRVHEHLKSADSLAWSFKARKNPPLPGCTHKSCANCELYAMQWRQKVLNAIRGPKPPERLENYSLFELVEELD